MATTVSIASVLIAALGLFFTGWQLLIQNRQAAHDRRVALEGVVVSWRAVRAPDHGDQDGTAVWSYEFAAHNPGTLPIDNVVIRWHFEIPVQRVRSTRLGKRSKVLTFRTPVIPGNSVRTWERRLRMEFTDSKELRRSTAEITFFDMDRNQHTNEWPRSIGGELPTHDPDGAAVAS